MISCINLRPDYERPGYLIRIDTPDRVLAGGGWRPRAEMTDAAGRRLLAVTSGHTLGIVCDRRIISSVRLPAEALAVFVIGERLVVMTAAGRSVYTLSGDKLSADTAAGAGAMSAGCSLYAVDSPSMAWYAPSLTLSKAYGGARELTEADRRKVAAHAAAVYRGLDTAARTGGYMWQPAVGYLRLLRADGSTAGTTPPVVLTHPARRPEGMSLSFDSADTATIAGGLRDFTAWRAGVSLPAMPGAGIAAVEVVISPLLHAARADADAAIVSGLGVSPFCTVTLPPGSAAEYGRPDMQAAVAAVAARLDECGTVVATLAGPFDTARRVEIPVTLPDDVDAANAAVRRLLVSGPAESGDASVSATLAELRGGEFTATACAVAGGAVVWSGLSVRPMVGTGPQAYAAATADAPWRGYVCVRYADGSAAVATASASTAAPVALGPMLYVPSPRAVSLEIGLDITGRGTYRDTFPLTAAAGGAGAAYASPDMRPMSPTSLAGYAVPQAVAAASELPGVIAVASSASPFAITAVAHTAVGPVVSLVAARFGQSAWDFGRARFYALGPGGIHSVATSSRLDSISVSRLDSRRVDCPAAESPYGVMAVAGTDVVCIAGSRLETLWTGAACAGLLFDGRRHELWCLSRGSECTVLCGRRKWEKYSTRVGALDPTSALSAPSGAYVATADGDIIDIATPGLPEDMEVSLAVELRPSESRAGRQLPQRSVTVDIEGRVDSLDVSLSRSHHGRRSPAPDVGLRVSGRLRSPLRLPWYGPASSTAVLTVAGTAAPGLTIRRLKK